MKIDAIYFDLDGTLWETTDITYESANVITDKYNLPKVSRETIEKCMGKTKQECASLCYPNFPLEKAIKYLEESLTITTNKLKTQGGNVYDGLEDTLKELKKNYKLGIVSNCLGGYIEAFLTSSKLGKYFDNFIAAGKEEIKKSDAIKLIIAEDNVKRAIYVGDTIKDKEAALEAGIEFIHAKYGFEKKLNTKYYIDDIKELPCFMQKINI